MGERKGVNKYYPPDFDPGKGGLNKYHGTHALRERARKLHEGILIIRFEMPYNIWCNGCGNHIGMGVRYNAQKRKVGNYYTTPIYKFRMKCHLCDQHFEIQTDPKNCEYEILSGARRKEERWDPAVTENIQTTDRDVKAKLVSDAMYKLEHNILDKQKAKQKAPTLGKLRDIRDVWQDDFAINQALRRKFREEKVQINNKKAADEDLKKRALLPSSMPLVDEALEDTNLAARIKYGEGNVRPDLKRKKRKLEIKRSSIFQGNASSKEALARHLAGNAPTKQVFDSSSETKSISKNTQTANIVVKRPKNDSQLSGSLVSDARGSDTSKSSLSVKNITDKMDLTGEGQVNDLLSHETVNASMHEEEGINNDSQQTQISKPTIISPDECNISHSSLIVTYSSSSECSDG